jgi:hypothetical protein
MRILIRTVALVLACSLLFAGCDSLNKAPPDELSSEQVWKDPALTKSYLNEVYSGIGWGFGDPMIAGLADEAVNTHGHGDGPTKLSSMTPDSRGLWDWGWEEVMRKFQWEQLYSRIRDLNLFLRNVDGSEVLGSSTKETLLGEAYFLRAYYYHNLMRVHGGVPLIAKVFELQGDLEQYQVSRGSFKETINFIVADLDSAAARLSVDARQKGSPTKGAALALKCRVRVHAASDLFAENPSGMPETGYTGGSQQERWQTAKEACQAVIDMNKYSLEQVNSFHEYHELFTKGNPSGTIWARHFKEQGGEAHNHSLWVSPNGWLGWTGDAPTQQHVDAYEMADGSQFEWEGGDPESASEPVDVENPYESVDEESPYEKRDPRFYANIHYNGADWRTPRASGLAELDPKGVIQTGWYEVPNQEEPRAGLDTREGPLQNWNGTKTGYVLRKFVDKDIDPFEEQAYNPWPFLRYAEVLLNYAEASAELGDPEDALRELNKVRNRVDMPDVPPDGGPERTLMERIRQEREVELAFEEFRFFDVRRWMIAPEVYSESGKGIRIEGELDPNGELLVEHRYDYKYNVREVDQRQWKDRNYFVPIPKDEMNRNSELVQNPGY